MLPSFSTLLICKSDYFLANQFHHCMKLVDKNDYFRLHNGSLTVVELQIKSKTQYPRIKSSYVDETLFRCATFKFSDVIFIQAGNICEIVILFTGESKIENPPPAVPEFVLCHHDESSPRPC